MISDEEYARFLERDIIKFANEKPVTKKDARLWELPEMPYEHGINIEGYNNYAPYMHLRYAFNADINICPKEEIDFISLGMGI